MTTQLTLEGTPADPDDDRIPCPKGCGALIYPRGRATHLASDCPAVDRDPFGETDSTGVRAR